jgi:XTP/dITP diphosphohydrolase
MNKDPLTQLREVMDQLRSPGGCPWDSEQTHKSLLKYLLEESYEFIDSVEKNDRDGMLEELGDLLLQVFFHARIAEERSDNPFSIDEVAGKLIEKLISRHPHVFSDVKVNSSEEAINNWEKLKNSEKSRNDIFDGVPFGQPALSLATKLLARARDNNKELPAVDREELLTKENLGDQIMALLRFAIENNLDPEAQLRASALRFAEGSDRSI